MSWWDTSGIQKLANQALQQAQSKIDKVLDIQNEGESATSGVSTEGDPFMSSVPVESKSQSKEDKKAEGDFWGSWGVETSGNQETDSVASSWSKFTSKKKETQNARLSKATIKTASVSSSERATASKNLPRLNIAKHGHIEKDTSSIDKDVGLTSTIVKPSSAGEPSKTEPSIPSSSPTKKTGPLKLGKKLSKTKSTERLSQRKPEIVSPRNDPDIDQTPLVKASDGGHDALSKAKVDNAAVPVVATVKEMCQETSPDSIINDDQKSDFSEEKGVTKILSKTDSSSNETGSSNVTSKIPDESTGPSSHEEGLNEPAVDVNRATADVPEESKGDSQLVGQKTEESPEEDSIKEEPCDSNIIHISSTSEKTMVHNKFNSGAIENQDGELHLHHDSGSLPSNINDNDNEKTITKEELDKNLLESNELCNKDVEVDVDENLEACEPNVDNLEYDVEKYNTNVSVCDPNEDIGERNIDVEGKRNIDVQDIMIQDDENPAVKKSETDIEVHNTSIDLVESLLVEPDNSQLASSSSESAMSDQASDTKTISDEKDNESDSKTETDTSTITIEGDTGGSDSLETSKDHINVSPCDDTIADIPEQSKPMHEQLNVEIPQQRHGPDTSGHKSDESDSPTPHSEHTSSDSEAKQRKRADSLTSTSSSGSSFVRCEIAEAMTESAATQQGEDVQSGHSSGSEKSDLVKIGGSEVTSGHTSGDEVDTTTSSDIEIISTPTSNGEYRMERPFDLSPLRHAFSQHSGRGRELGHNRSDSNSSAQSRKSEQGSPEPPKLDARQSLREGEQLASKLIKPEVKDTREDTNPLQTEKLLKKLASMAEVLDAREKKLLELSKENIDLQETSAVLRSQLQQSEEAREMEMADLNEITEEFTQRISDSEKKLQATCRERDNMKKQLQSMQGELSSSKQTESLMLEKDQQISELLEEGEKLSKQQLQSNNIIKKLRSKEKETDSLVKSQKQKLDEQKTEIERLHKVLDSKEDMETKQKDAINQLNAAVKKQEKDLSKYKADLEESLEKARGLQSALDNSYKELAELHKAQATKSTKVQEEKLSQEMAAKEEIRFAMEKQQLVARKQQEGLVMQVEDLQLSVSRMEKEHSRRENRLRQEISDLQQRLQEGEVRNQELTQSVSGASRPLLRQIENLQATYSAQTVSYERIEKNLTERLAEVQGQLATATEKERMSSEKAMELSTKLTSLESQVRLLRQEKSRLTAEKDMLSARIEVLEDAKNNESAQLEALKHSLNHDLQELKKEKILLENQLEMEKIRTEAEKKKLLLAHESMREKDLQAMKASSTPPSRSPRQSHSRQSSVTSENAIMPLSQEEVLERTLMLASSNGNKASLYDSLRQTGAATIMENLESQLKLREGEILQLQSEIGSLERTRESMARELVNLSTHNDELQEKLDVLEDIREKYTELDGRYNAMLLMYGEKEEQVQELRLDLADVKEMYKTQIDQLLRTQ
ncbi:unnamed protein product [Owenia fusiformis]|uniref:TATA element modulatory factor 1 TATA binding domain-containing protein n=1 Tax=Owenia fusiformis TaxID=6347 RepID=A0A8S4PJ01_OWEFU|nr:unnamed protein product [Owenia fusiformis]